MFEHNGVKIEFNENTGKFYAGDIESSSLAAIKKKLDKSASFQKFEALITQHWSSDLKRIEIVGIAKGRGKYGSNAMPKWKDSSGGEHLTVYEATAENEAAIKRVFDLRKANAKEFEEMNKRHDEAHKKVWAAVKTIEPPKL